jgi:hypothetical protein
MHAIRSRAVGNAEIGQSRSGAMREIMMHGPYYDQPARCCSPARARDSGRIKLLSRDLRKVVWPPNFKPSTIDKYDGSTNPVEWLKVYQLAIEDAGGDSYVMANYLLIYLSSSART